MLKYTHLRPRRMAFAGGTVAATASVHGTAQLFNNSSYAEYLILRDFQFGSTAGSVWFITLNQTTLSLTAVAATPYLPIEAPPPGAVSQGTTATALATNGYNLAQFGAAAGSWGHDFPFCIIPPGWYLSIQVLAVNQALYYSLMWEAIKPEQLDEAYWLAANAALQQNG